MIRLLIRAMRGDAAMRLEEKIDKAAKAVADCRGEIAVSQYMLDFYKARRSNIDPMDDHWGFAQAREKEHDNDKDLKALQRLLEERWARMEALTEQRRQLLEE